MARTKTLLQLRTEIYDRTDVDPDSNYVSESEMNTMINGSIAELYDLIVAANKDYYFDEESISVVSGTKDYDLPSDFYRVLWVDVIDGSDYYPLRRFTPAERNQFQTSGQEKKGTRYRVIGGKMRLRPTPEWSGTINLGYTPAPSLLSADSDTFDGISGWEEYVIVDCCIKIAQKQEEDASLLIKQKADLASRVRELAAERDDHEPDRVRDVCLETVGIDWPEL